MANRRIIALLCTVVMASLMLSGCGSKKPASAPAAGDANGTPATDSQTPTTDETAGNSDTAKAYKTMKELMAAGQPLSCTWSKTDDSGESQGKIFVDGKKFRTDVIIGGKNEAGEDKLEVEMHSLSDGTMVYTWNSMPGGKAIKMDLSKLEKPADTPDTKPEGEMNFDEELDYECSAWTVDETVFNLPTDIEFTDQTAAMNGIINAAQNMQGSVTDESAGSSATPDACALCKMAPEGEARDNCLKSANCEQ